MWRTRIDPLKFGLLSVELLLEKGNEERASEIILILPYVVSE